MAGESDASTGQDARSPRRGDTGWYIEPATEQTPSRSGASDFYFEEEDFDLDVRVRPRERTQIGEDVERRDDAAPVAGETRSCETCGCTRSCETCGCTRSCETCGCTRGQF